MGFWSIVGLLAFGGAALSPVILIMYELIWGHSQYQLNVDSQPTTRWCWRNGSIAASQVAGSSLAKLRCSGLCPSRSTTQAYIELACRSTPH
ncbi:MAG: hypothetical protein QGF59_31105 [Pirellulaceae bacterium]|nr:hypothetical protein [Pirellulaceae bacterium]